MFGLDINLADFYALADRDKSLAPLVQRFRGLKPPSFPSLFEALVNAIACQQLSLTAGIAVLNRLAAQSGPTVTNDGVVQDALPRPADVLLLTLDSLRVLGFSFAKARSLLELAQIATTGHLEPGKLERLRDEDILSLLLSLRGIGRWTAEYALLRGLGREPA